MQIWEPCMPVLGSTPLLLRLPDLIVLPSTIFHRFLSPSLSLSPFLPLPRVFSVLDIILGGENVENE